MFNTCEEWLKWQRLYEWYCIDKKSSAKRNIETLTINRKTIDYDQSTKAWYRESVWNVINSAVQSLVLAQVKKKHK